MAEYIPFIPSENNYRLGVPLPSQSGQGSTRVLFDTRWNARDSIDPVTGKARGAWYVDIYEEDETPIILGVKVVLGTRFGRVSAHPFFEEHVLYAMDTSNSGIDAKYDDLGGRIQVVHMTMDEFRRAL